MADSEKNQALKRKIEELEKQAARERQEAATWLEKLKRRHEVKMLKDRQLIDQELQALNVNYSYLQHQYKSLLQRHMLLLDAFTDVKSVTFEEYITAKADNAVQDQISSIRGEAENRMEALQSRIKQLLAESASAKENNASLRDVISTKLDEIGKLEALVNSLITDARKSSAKIQELETTRDALDKALNESTQSLSVKANEMSEMQSQYNTEKQRLEDELGAFRKANEILNEKFLKEEKEREAKRKEEEEEIKRKKEEEDNRKREGEIKRKEEDEKVRRSVQPRSNTPGREASSAVFTPITCTESICKYMVKAGVCCYRYGLDINKYNVLAVAYDWNSVYLYSETKKMEEKLCTCQYGVWCLAWNQQGTLLAIGGLHNNNTNKTIQVWDIPNRKINKWLKIKDNDQICYCLDWKGDTITAGTDNYIYQWNINDQDNDQDTQGNKALLPRKTIQNEYSGWIATVQWSNCKSKLATITRDGDMCIYDEEFKLIHHNKPHENNSEPLLQWCPWDNQAIATGGWVDNYLKIWRVQQGITLIKEVKHDSGIANMKWILSEKAIITALGNNQLVLWEYPSLSIIRTIKGHTDIPKYLSLNADKSAMVSKSDKEMIFWKPFDQFYIQSNSQEATRAEVEKTHRWSRSKRGGLLIL